MKNVHLVILKKPYLDAILAGQKTIESRFMKNKCSPFGRVKPGDNLFLKISSGPVCAKAVAGRVRNFEDLTSEEVAQIKDKYNCQILGTSEYWLSRADCKVGLLVWLENVRPIKPIQISKTDWRGWVVLTSEKNFGLLESY